MHQRLPFLLQLHLHLLLQNERAMKSANSVAKTNADCSESS